MGLDQHRDLGITHKLISLVQEKDQLVTMPREQELLQLPITRGRKLLGGSNTTMHIGLQNDGGGVFKPGKGENCLEIKEACYRLYQRERAAYLVSRALGLDFVPPTVIRTIDDEEGSFQHFIDGASNIWDVDNRGALQEQMYAIAVFDYCIWNKDRKDANMLVGKQTEKQGKLWAIDNGLSFDKWFEYAISENLESFVFNKQAPLEVRNKFESYLRNSTLQEKLRQELQFLLPKSAADTALKRIKRIATLLNTHGIIQKDDVSDPNRESGWRDYYLRYDPDQVALTNGTW